ncbi:MAG: hypothetical protein RXO54_08105 [Acidilobus sp.]
MSDRKKVAKKKQPKIVIKLIAPLIPILGILAGFAYLLYEYIHFYNDNEFIAFLGLWLVALEFNLIVLYIKYLGKYGLWSSDVETRFLATKAVRFAKIMVYIFTAVGVFAGSFLLVVYKAATSGLNKVPAPLTSQEAALTLLLLILLPLLAYAVKKETEKAIRLGKESVTSA